MSQSQFRPGSIDRFPGLLAHGTIKRNVFEAQGAECFLLILEEGTGRNREDWIVTDIDHTSSIVSANL